MYSRDSGSVWIAAAVVILVVALVFYFLSRGTDTTNTTGVPPSGQNAPASVAPASGTASP